MWAVNESNNTDGTWKYGRVSLPSVAKHRVSTIPQVFLHYVQFTKRNETIQECRFNTKNSSLCKQRYCYVHLFVSVFFFFFHPFERVSWLPECQIKLTYVFKLVYNYSKKVNSMYVGNEPFN